MYNQHPEHPRFSLEANTCIHSKITCRSSITMITAMKASESRGKKKKKRFVTGKA
jgi:hypothetical protein